MNQAPTNIKDGEIIQLAHVVEDIDATMKLYYEVFGYGPWTVYDFKPPLLRESMYRGRPATHEYLVAVTWVERAQVEFDAAGKRLQHIQRIPGKEQRRFPARE